MSHIVVCHDKKRKLDARYIIYNNIIDLVGPSKVLWFPAIITKLCTQYGVGNEKNEEKVKVGLPIIARSSIGVPQIGRHQHGATMLDELNQIREMQQKMIN